MLLRRLPQITVAAILFVLGASVAVTEARAVVSGRTAGVVPGESIPLPGMSADAKFKALMHCDRAMAEPRFSLQSDPSRRHVGDLCAGLSGLVLDDAPSHGFAHFIAAASAVALGLPERAADHLAASQSYARREGWLAERRFLLLRTIEPAVRNRLLANEIGVMLTTQNGAFILAEALAGPSVMGSAILAEADEASPADRQRLLNLVRRKADGA